MYIKNRLNHKTAMISFEFNHKFVNIIMKAIYKVFFYVYMVACHHPGIGLVDKTSRITGECSVFSAVCLGP